MATTTTAPAPLAAFAPSTPSTAPSGPATPSAPAAPATPAIPATPATPAAEPPSLQQRIQQAIKPGLEGATLAEVAPTELTPIERAAQEAAAAATPTAPGVAATPEQPAPAEGAAAEAGEYDDFTPDLERIGLQDLQTKIAASPELKAAIDANPEVRDLIFANARLAKAVVAGHQAIARIRDLLGAVKRDDFGSTQVLLAKFGSPLRPRVQKRPKPGKRDAVIFAAILLELKGARYCSFLGDRELRPKWSDSGSANYTKSYQAGGSLRKKVQDEKTRARTRMARYTNPQLADAFNMHLPDRFHELSILLKEGVSSRL